jgi:hypothetical protein
MNDREQILSCREERDTKVLCSMTEITCNNKSQILTTAYMTFDWLILQLLSQFGINHGTVCPLGIS